MIKDWWSRFGNRHPFIHGFLNMGMLIFVIYFASVGLAAQQEFEQKQHQQYKECMAQCQCSKLY